MYNRIPMNWRYCFLLIIILLCLVGCSSSPIVTSLPDIQTQVFTLIMPVSSPTQALTASVTPIIEQGTPAITVASAASSTPAATIHPTSTPLPPLGPGGWQALPVIPTHFLKSRKFMRVGLPWEIIPTLSQKLATVGVPPPGFW